MTTGPSFSMRAAGRALVTGGAGFIGSHLAEALLAQGWQVTAIDNLSTGSIGNVAHLLDRPDFRLVTESITNAVVIDRLAGECDVIFHLAAAVGVDLIVKNPVHTIETNILGTQSVLTAAHRHQRRVLLASTSEVYGKSARVPFHEEDDRLFGPTTRSRWSYAESKAVDEFLGLAYWRQMRTPVVICRLFNTVGPRQTGRYGMVVPRFVQQALNGERLTVYGDGRQARCFLDVSDAVRAMIALVDCPAAPGQVVNVGSTQEITIVDLARKVIALVNEEGRSDAIDQGIVFVPYDQAYEEGFEDMRRRVPDISRIGALIGWRPQVRLEETLRRVVEHFRTTAAAAPMFATSGTSS